MAFIDWSKEKWCGFCGEKRDKSLSRCPICKYQLRNKPRRNYKDQKIRRQQRKEQELNVVVLLQKQRGETN
jgi:hypothetical protein